MEVHAPHGPVGNWREFMVHLATVTIGILIALSLEQATEWYHHKAMVREAEANIRNEILDNKKAIDEALPKMVKNVGNMEESLQVVMDVLAHKKLVNRSVTVAFSTASMQSTSWRAAQAVGALSYMEYPKLKKYAGVYETQGEYERLQQRAMDVTMNAFALFRADPEALSTGDLEEARKQLLAAISAGRIQQQVVKQLSEQYSQGLGNKE